MDRALELLAERNLEFIKGSDLWTQLFSERTAGYAIAYTVACAEAGDTEAIAKMALFNNTKALRRLTK